MFREMRRKRQMLSKEECEQVLYRGTSGVLAVSGDDGYPYPVLLSYVHAHSCIYFHCAKSGHKLDAIRRDAKVSFCVIDRDQVVPEEYTTYFCSVIVFGKIRILEEEQEKRRAIQRLAVKYAPEDSEAARQAAIERECAPLCMLELVPDYISGKEAIELVKTKEKEKQQNG